jgi:hypothetical protein
VEAIPEEGFDITVSEGFYGATYAKGRLWEYQPDSIELWRRPISVQTEIHEGGRVERASSMFFEERLTGADPYSVFLDGNHAEVRLINPSAASGKLLIIKDSYAHCLAPFLAGHYQEIQMIDLRFYKKNLTAQFIEETGADEVLFVYGVSGLTGSGDFVWLSGR